MPQCINFHGATGEREGMSSPWNFPLSSSTIQKEGYESYIWSVHFFVYPALPKIMGEVASPDPASLIETKITLDWHWIKLLSNTKPPNVIQRPIFTFKFLLNGSFLSEQTKKLTVKSNSVSVFFYFYSTIYFLFSKCLINTVGLCCLLGWK